MAYRASEYAGEIMRLLVIPFAAVLAFLSAAPGARADVVISTAQTQNINCSDGVCSPTASNAVLNVTDLENLLGSGDVKVTTTGSGVQDGNLDVQAKLSWSAAGVLWLDAYQSIMVASPILVEGTGGLTVTTSDGGSGGELGFSDNGHVFFEELASALSINGTGYTLIDSIAMLANDVAKKPRGNYALAENYNASKDGIYTNPPVATTFTGSFEGLGNTISNLSINSNGFAGMFAQLGLNGTIRDVGVDNVNFTATSDAGALVALNEAGMVISSHSSGSIVSSGLGADVGGLVGTSCGRVKHHRATLAEIIGSHSKTAVTGSGQGASIGGLVGYGCEYSEIENSSASGTVSAGIDGWAGGLVGTSIASIQECFATGQVSVGDGDGQSDPAPGAGGLVGYVYSAGGEIIENSYATGSVSGGNASSVGGLVGINGGPLKYSYSLGVPNAGDRSYVGGSIGTQGGNVEDDYWDTTSSGTKSGVGFGNNAGVTGLTTHQLKGGLPSGLNPSVWAESHKINSGFPYLISNPPN